MAVGTPIWLRWREPAIQAALVNGALILIVPVVWLTYGDYTSEAVRPHVRAVWRSALHALPVLGVGVPAAVLVAWRSYVHAVSYLTRRITIWRGPIESAAIAAGIALLQARTRSPVQPVLREGDL